MSCLQLSPWQLTTPKPLFLSEGALELGTTRRPNEITFSSCQSLPSHQNTAHENESLFKGPIRIRASRWWPNDGPSDVYEGVFTAAPLIGMLQKSSCFIVQENEILSKPQHHILFTELTYIVYSATRLALPNDHSIVGRPQVAPFAPCPPPPSFEAKTPRLSV